MAEYSRCGPDNFDHTWAKDDSSHDTPMTKASHTIVKEVRAAERDNCKAIAAHAAVKYPGNLFNMHFSYRKNGHTIVMTNPRSIAKKYSELQRLESVTGSSV